MDRGQRGNILMVSYVGNSSMTCDCLVKKWDNYLHSAKSEREHDDKIPEYRTRESNGSLYS